MSRVDGAVDATESTAGRRSRAASNMRYVLGQPGPGAGRQARSGADGQAEVAGPILEDGHAAVATRRRARQLDVTGSGDVDRADGRSAGHRDRNRQGVGSRIVDGARGIARADARR